MVGDRSGHVEVRAGVTLRERNCSRSKRLGRQARVKTRAIEVVKKVRVKS